MGFLQEKMGKGDVVGCVKIDAGIDSCRQKSCSNVHRTLTE